MKTIIIGYRDGQGLCQGEIFNGPAAEQAEIMEDAKRRHIFPEGCLRIEQYALAEPVDVAMFISDAAAEAAQDIDATKAKQRRDEQEKARAQQKAEAIIIQANKAFTTMADKRNKAIAAVAVIKGRLQDADSKTRDDLAKKITQLQAVADQAVAEFAVVRDARDTIKNPKSLADAVGMALARMKDPAAAVKADKDAAERAEAERLQAIADAEQKARDLELQQQKQTSEAGGQKTEENPPASSATPEA